MIVQRAQDTANEKMLQAVAQAVQHAMAAALATAATANVAPAGPTPAYELPSRFPTRAPSRSLSVARRDRHYEPYTVDGGAPEKQRRQSTRRDRAEYGAKYSGEWKSGAGEISED